ncbi:uncharacterized protein LOC126827762 [Patella vulgata]|uniref:uncharacterized protein LOC126827762 n=1 Tax=Patella vulgata TaxID=6465 RepID=UPI00217FEFEE|nr:uncharacterized protein LOC126827762 [Patella vulgata]
MPTSSLVIHTPLLSLNSHKPPTVLKSAAYFVRLASAPLSLSLSGTGANDIYSNNGHLLLNPDETVCPGKLQTLSPATIHSTEQLSLSRILEDISALSINREIENPQNSESESHPSNDNGVLKEKANFSNNAQKKKNSKKISKGKNSRKRKRQKTPMKSKASAVDLPAVAKSSAGLTAAYKTSKLDLGGAQCTAIKIHQPQPQPQPRYYNQAPDKMVKNGEYFKSVYSSSPFGTKACHSASLSLTTQSHRKSRSNNSDFGPSVRSVSPKVCLSRRSVSQANDTYIKRITKIYQSQSQSGTVEVCGVDLPCAPPATPTPEQLKYHQYIPSLNDVMAQRAIKLRLEKIERKELKKMDKRKEEEIKQEKLQQKDKLIEKRRKQRLEIYALNKIMTELENKKFQEFCQIKGIY